MSLERPTFPMVRLREGYDSEQVDLAVQIALENLALPQPRIDRGDIEGLLFAPVRRGGYEMTSVDEWFDLVAAELDRRAGVQPDVAAPAPAAYEPVEAPDVIVDLDARTPDTDSELVQLMVKVVVVVVVAVLLYVAFA